MNRLHKVLLPGIVFLLPAVVLLGAVNLTARMPDFYQYQFNSNNTSNVVGLTVESDELAGFFSDFMLGKNEDFSLEAESMDGVQDNLFEEREQSAMIRFRNILNLFSAAGAVVFLALAIGYYRLIRHKKGQGLRRAFLLSIPIFLVYEVGFVALLRLPSTGGTVVEFFLGGAFPEGGILVQILDQGFMQSGFLVTSVLGGIAYIILGMITWSFTKPYRMFGPSKRK